MSEERTPFDYLPDDIRKQVINNGFEDSRYFSTIHGKKVWGIRNIGESLNKVDGAMYAVGGHSIMDALLETIRVHYQQALANTVLMITDYIANLFTPFDDDASEDAKEQYKQQMILLNQTDGDGTPIADFIKGFAEELKDRENFDLMGKLLRKMVDGEPELYMLGNPEIVDSAIGRKVNRNEYKVTDDNIKKFLDSVMSSEEEE